MAKRAIRVGIDVGGTHTKAVAIDNATHEIIGKGSVKTTHDHPSGVAAGVIEAFKLCLTKNNIHPEDVIFIAHSTTQATNALLEGDVAEVGVIGIGSGGIGGWLAKKQTKIDDIDLGTGRIIKTHHRYMKQKQINQETIKNTIRELKDDGAGVFVASKAFGVDDLTEEKEIQKLADEHGIPVSVASEISKLYGLTRRTRTATINASILPKMLETANSTEGSVRQAGIQVPLMIMRGDGGVMGIDEMRKRPVLTMLSGPAASVVGALMYLRASNGIYFEVGGTSTNIGVIKNGRPAVDYSIVGGHPTYISSLDVRVLGVAGGSMVRASKEGIVDVGPRSAHIGGMPYAVFTPIEEIVDPQVEFFSPKEGDPADYVYIKLKNGNKITITNSCAANVLGYVNPEHYAYGNPEAARKAMEPLAKYMNKTVEEVAAEILQKSYEKIKPVIEDFAEKYKLEKDQISLVGVGGGCASLLPFTAKNMELDYSIPENAEVISSIGVALAMIRDVVERVIPTPTKKDIADLKKEAASMAIANGAVPDSVEVQIEIDSQTNKVTAIAMGSSEVQATDLLMALSEEEAKEIAAKSMGVPIGEAELITKSDVIYVFSAKGKKEGAKQVRIIDKKGFIKVQRGDAIAEKCTVAQAQEVIAQMWETLAIFKSDIKLSPDIYLCIGGKVLDYTGMLDKEQLYMVVDTELGTMEPHEEIIIVGAKNDL
ncbi:hydantoinase/oxoprolinase family protein [Neobacillus sp. YIM B06451]|uniref:hydantoinase/oxoprolinase family protein n=1 Tax=Neobacillus sp. YIM B06451 TaxID=3070994 RepID=UPI00292D0F25|nr:hydantoinase/oxoprolinase family protein [Neobacillus sp. YIM B06451]